jgi:hypothetical protein
MKIPMNLHLPPPSSPVSGEVRVQREEERRTSEEREREVENEFGPVPFVYIG